MDDWIQDQLSIFGADDSTLKEADRLLDGFHRDVVLSSENERNKYERAQSLENEFQESLYYGMNAATILNGYVFRVVDRMKENGGTPDEVTRVIEKNYQNFREQADEKLREAKESLDLVEMMYEDIAYDTLVEDVNEAVENYREVIQYGKEQITKPVNIREKVDDTIEYMSK